MKHSGHDLSHDPIAFAVLTVSDSRTTQNDVGGDRAVAVATAAGHAVGRRGLVRDEVDAIRAWVEGALRDTAIDAIVVTGGTGVAPRDVTPEALAGLFEKSLPGFGEAFRRLSFDEVGPAGILSRAEAGIARGKGVFLLPGSPDAVALAMERLVLPVAGHVRHLART